MLSAVTTMAPSPMDALDQDFMSAGGAWAVNPPTTQAKSTTAQTSPPPSSALHTLASAAEDLEMDDEEEDEDEEVLAGGNNGNDTAGEEAEAENDADEEMLEPGDEDFIPDAEANGGDDGDLAIVVDDVEAEIDAAEEKEVEEVASADSKRGSRSSAGRKQADADGSVKVEESLDVPVRERKQPYNGRGERVYCVCRKPDTGTFMIQCDKCQDWYHGKCIQISEELGKALDSYECDECKEFRIKMDSSKVERRKNQAEAPQDQRKPKSRKKELSCRITAIAQSEKSTNANAPNSRHNPALQAPPAPNHSAFPTVDPSTFWAHGHQAPNPVVQRIYTARPPPAKSSKTKRGSVSSSLGSASTPTLPTPTFIAEPDVGPDSKAWESDKARVAARKQFMVTFETIRDDAELKAERDATENAFVLEPEKLAAEVEDEMFDRFSDGAKGFKRACGEKYKSKFRTLQYNLKDKKNVTLRSQILTGAMTAAILVQLEAGDLANDEIKAKSEKIRLESIRNALKPKDTVTNIYKKTHKGEEAMVETPTAREETPEPDPVEEESKVYGVRATGGAFARLVAQRSASPSKPAAPVMALDELLAKMDGDNTKKRHSPTPDDDRELKRSKYTEDAAYDVDQTDTYDPGYAASGAIAGGMGDFGGGWGDVTPQENFDVMGGSTTPPYSPNAETEDLLPPPPPPPMEPEVDDDAAVWSGSVRMAQVGWFAGRCRQVAGRRVGAARIWEAILAPTVTIEGR
ncbi:Transcription factor bye1, partial [Irineochytrium annulatum]